MYVMIIEHVIVEIEAANQCKDPQEMGKGDYVTKRKKKWL